MAFEGWPDIRRECPICGEAGCATFRGYYLRFMMCPELEIPPGLIAIRTGLCRSTGSRFSLLPDFLIRYRRLSRFGLATLREQRARPRVSLLQAIDALTADLGDEFYLPLSTAYAYLHVDLSQPP